MHLKTIIIALVLIAAAGGLIVLGYRTTGGTAASVQGAHESKTRSALTASSVSYDFGKISMGNGSVSYDFAVENPTDRDVEIRDVQTSCMCTSALIIGSDGLSAGPFGMPGMGGSTAASVMVKAHEKAMLRVIFDPNAHGPAGVGNADRFVTLTDSTGATVQYEIKALVTP